MQLLQTVRHPEALPMNLVHQTPIHRRCAGSQGLVYTIAESHSLHAPEAVWKLQANLHARKTMVCCRVRGSCTARGILVDVGSIGFHPTARQQTDHTVHNLLESLQMLWYGALGIGRRLKRCLLLALAPTMQDRCVTVRPEEPAQELAHHCERAAFIQHECRERRRLLNAPPGAYAGQRADGVGERLRQHDGPLPLVVACCRRTRAGKQLNIVENRLAIQGLPNMHPALPQEADRAVAKQMAEQARERQCAQALMRCVHPERQVAHVQRVTGFVVTRLVQRGLKANHDAILTQYELVGTHPAPVRAEEFMVRGADQRAPVLQGERDALALALNHHLGLCRCAQPAVLSESVQRCSASTRHLLDAPRGAVGKQYWRSLSNTGCAAIANQVEV